jgi:hypothetical protein
VSKSSGIGWTTLTVDDASGTPQAIKNDFTNLQFATPRAVFDVTGIDKFAIERILGLADFSITLNGPHDPAANQSHAVFSTVSSTQVNRTTAIVVNGKTLNNEVLYTDYPLTRTNSGEFTYAVPGVLGDGTVPTWS